MANFHRRVFLGRENGVIAPAVMLMFQVVVNIFMTIGLGPVTGIPLPFMSYGRSAMVVNFIELGTTRALNAS